MVKSVALDTNIVIDFLKGKKNFSEKLLQYDSLYLPVTVVGELLFGAINSTNKEKQVAICRNFLKHCKILDINFLTAEKYAEVRKQLKDKGTPIPENDIWIAATCIFYNIPIITDDKHFYFINNLKIQTL